MDAHFYLYRLDTEGDGKIYGKFDTLSAAKMSADLLLIKDFCFILSGDLTKLYFYEDGEWSYDILTPKGRAEFFDIYPNPEDYK